jgi:L-amino acid N-acyltransferase YncA
MRAGLHLAGQTLGRVFYQRAEYLVLSCALSEFVPTGRSECGASSTGDLAQLAMLASSADRARFDKMFSSGSMVFIAYVDGQVVGYCWASQEIDAGINRAGAALGLRAASGDVYTHDLFIAPGHRNQGWGARLLSDCLQSLRQAGYKRAVAAVEPANAPSLKVIKRLGYVTTGELRHTRILLWDRFVRREYEQAG